MSPSFSHASSEAEDAALFVRYATHDCTTSLDQLLARYRPRLRTFFLKRLEDTERADDLSSEVVVRIQRHRHRYDPSRRFSTWVFTIAMNLFKNELRSIERNPTRPFTDCAVQVHPGEPLRAFEPVCTDPSPEEQAYAGELRERIDAALAEIPELFRTPFVLYAVEGYPLQDVATVLEVPVGTVKSRLYRARALLREALADLSPVAESSRPG